MLWVLPAICDLYDQGLLFNNVERVIKFIVRFIVGVEVLHYRLFLIRFWVGTSGKSVCPCLLLLSSGSCAHSCRISIRSFHRLSDSSGFPLLHGWTRMI